MNTLYEVGIVFIIAGKKKVEHPIDKTLILAIFGGFMIGLSACLSSICGNYYIEGYSQFYKGISFPIGIILVYCAGGELITGNFLLTIALFANAIKTLDLIISWLIVLVGNLIGSILISLLIAYGHIPNMFNVNLAQIVIVTGNNKCALNFGEAFIKAFLANFFNCLGLWIAMFGKDMRSVILGMFIPNFLIMALDLNHIVADMFYILVGLFTSYEYGLDSTEMGWGKLFYKSIIPNILGGLVGGALLVGIMYFYVFINVDDTGNGRIEKNKKYINKANESIQQIVETDNKQNNNKDKTTLNLL